MKFFYPHTQAAPTMDGGGTNFPIPLFFYSITKKGIVKQMLHNPSIDNTIPEQGVFLVKNTLFLIENRLFLIRNVLFLIKNIPVLTRNAPSLGKKYDSLIPL
jgi:hypothetical protein